MFSLWARIIIAVILITLALSNIQENRVLPAVGCLLLASFLIFWPKIIKGALLLAFGLAVTMGLGILQAIEDNLASRGSEKK